MHDSDSDFGADAKEELDDYVALQTNEQAREAQRQENKRLRAQNLPAKPLPKKVKIKKRRLREDDESDEEDEEGYNHAGKPRRYKASHFKTSMPEGREDELHYEGRECASPSS